MGGCVGRDTADVSLPDSASANLNATQRTCLESWKALLAGDTGYCRAAPPGSAPATLFFDAFFTQLEVLSPSTSAYFAHGGIPRKARALLRMVASLLALGGEGAGAAAEDAKLAAIAESHALAHGIGVAQYEPCIRALEHALRTLLGDGPGPGSAQSDAGAGADSDANGLWTADVAAAWRAQFERALTAMLPAAQAAQRPLVVIVGAGFAGWTLAKGLDASDDYRVLLIDRKEFLLFNVGSLRAAVQPDFADNVILPTRHGHSLRHATILHGDVLELTPLGVRLHGRSALLHFDVLVIASGSAYAFPGKIASPFRDEIRKVYAQCVEQVKSARRIVIAGGGAVGVELAGEIAFQYRDEAAESRKHVTLLQRNERLLPGTDVALADAALHQLRRMGVEVHLKEELQLSDADRAAIHQKSSLLLTPSASGQRLHCASGKELDADLLFLCWGTRINAASYERAFAPVMNAQRRLLCNAYLQVRDPSSTVADARTGAGTGAADVDAAAAAPVAPEPDAVSGGESGSGSTASVGPVEGDGHRYLSNVFVIGDACALEPTQAVYAGSQGAWLAKFLLARAAHARARPAAASTCSSTSAGAPSADKYAVPPVGSNAASADRDAAALPPYPCLSPGASPALYLSVGPAWGATSLPGAGFAQWDADKEPSDPAQVEAQGAAKLKASTLMAPIWWGLVGVDYARRLEVDWSPAQDQQQADDAAALALSMHLSITQARALLQQGAAVMNRAASTDYT